MDRRQAGQQAGWVEIQQFFDCLPPGLARQGRLLRNDLAFHYSDTARLEDILLRPGDYPSLSLLSALLDDYGFQQGRLRRKINKHLLAASFYTFATLYTQAAILDEGSFFDNDYLHLAQTLSQQADRELAGLLPAKSPFWELHRSAWADYAEAALFERSLAVGGTALLGTSEALQGKDRLAPYRLTPVAVAYLARREHHLPQLLSLLDHLHAAVVILQGLAHLEVDMPRGRFTAPYLMFMAELGVPVTKPPNPQAVRLAMALIGAVPRILQEGRRQLAAGLALAEELQLPSLAACLRQQEKIAQRMEESSSPGRLASPPLAFAPVKTSLAQAVEMAEGYLLADLTFRESWEVHRRGLAGAGLVTARFPAGLLLEVLCSQGHDLAQQVDEFFQYQQAHAFSYYDHPALPYVDTDSLGVLLRLVKYSRNPPAQQQALEIPLGWMRLSIQADGRIPVWIKHPPESARQANPPPNLLGEGCGSIEASLLSGLLEPNWQQDRGIIQASVAGLFERFSRQGPAISVNYPPGYCLWRIVQLLGALQRRRLELGLSARVNQVAQSLPEHLYRAAGQYQLSPQQAAFLALASAGPSRQDRFKRRWLTLLLKSQRPDGSWPAEPLFFVPNRGELTVWHSSDLLTTAYCYLALKACLE